jgi:Putative phage serine protease XkdF
MSFECHSEEFDTVEECCEAGNDEADCQDCFDEVEMSRPCAKTGELGKTCPCGLCKSRLARVAARKAARSPTELMLPGRIDRVDVVAAAANGRTWALAKHAGQPGRARDQRIPVETIARSRAMVAKIGATLAQSTTRKAISAPFIKAAETATSHYGLCVVLEPRTKENPDSQGDFYSAETIRALHDDYMQNSRKVGLQHKGEPLPSSAVSVVESYIAPQDLNVGGQSIPKGSWLMGLKLSPHLFQAIKDKLVTGLSIQGVATKRELAKALPTTRAPFTWPEDLALTAPKVQRFKVGQMQVGASNLPDPSVTTYASTRSNSPRQPASADDLFNSNGPATPPQGPRVEGSIAWFTSLVNSNRGGGASESDRFMANDGGQPVAKAVVWGEDLAKGVEQKAARANAARTKALLEKAAKDRNDLARSAGARVELGRAPGASSGMWKDDMAADVERRRSAARGAK